MRWLRRIARGVAYLTVAFVLVLAVAVALLHTDWGRGVLASTLSRMLSSDDATIRIGRIDGSIFSEFTLDRVTLADRQGVWLVVERAKVAWAPAGLLGKLIDITAIDIGRIAVERQPLPSAAAAPAQSGPAPSLPSIELRRLAVEEVALSEPVLGAPARLALNASLNLRDVAAGFSVALRAERIDGVPGTLRAEALYRPQAKSFSIAIDAEEPAGGLLSRLGKIEGLPAIKAELRGSGTLDSWTGTMDVRSGDEPLIRGAANITARGSDHALTLDLAVPRSRVIPQSLAQAFAEGATARAELTFGPAIGVQIARAEFVAAGVRMTVRGGIEPEFRRVAISYEMNAGDARVAPLLAPGLGWRSLVVSGAIEGQPESPTITTQGDVRNLEFRGNRAEALTFKIQATPRQAPRREAFFAVAGSGRVEGVTPADARLEAPLKPGLNWSLAADVERSGRADVSSLMLSLGSTQVNFAGQVSPQAIAGTLKLDRLDLAMLAPFVLPGIAGETSIEVAIDAATDLSRVALRMNGGASGLALGIPALDGLIAGKLDIAGGARRAADGTFAFERLVVRGTHVEITADGSATAEKADVAVRAALPDLARADPRVSGRALATGKLTGSLARPRIEAKTEITAATALGRRVDSLTFSLDVADAFQNPAGTFAASGTIDGKPVSGQAAITAVPGGERSVRNLEFIVGSVSARGNLDMSPQNRLTGRLDVKADNLTDVAALLLTEISGKAEASAVFSVAPDSRQEVRVEASAAAVSIPGLRLESLRLRADAASLSGSPSVDGTADLRGLVIGSTAVSSLRLTAKGPLSDTLIRLETSAMGAQATAAARLNAEAAEPSIRVESLRVARNAREIRLAAPTTVRFQQQIIALEKITLVSGGGTITIDGSVADALDVRVGIRNFPLSAAALAAPDIDIDGTLSGDIHVTGPANDPAARYDLAIAQLSNADVRALGAGPFAVKARGVAGAQRVQINATLTGPSIAAATVDGTVPLSNAGAMALTVKGRVDLAIANTMLSAGGARASGPLTVDVALSGSMRAPRLSGTMQLTDGRYEDPVNGFFFDKIQLTATGTNDAVTITRLSAATRNGGAITGDGRIGLDPGQGFPGRVALRAQNAVLVSNETVNAVADARLEFSGALARHPRIAGRVDVRSLEVTIPDRIPGSAVMIDVRHVNVPPELQASLPKPPPRPSNGAAASAFVADLDLTISAPTRVFVRGRGVDAELGGDLTLRGTTRAPILTGGFDMKRGRLELLGKTLAFSRGRATFPGDLDPALDFLATSNADDAVVTVTVSGRASDPKFILGSTPTLPQDEILARLFFGRPTSRLTAGQALQLAQAAAQLSGAGGPGVLDKVRRRLGVDTLDVGAGPQGNSPQVGMGRRINDRIYLGVRQGASPGSSRATVDIDLTRNIKIQGEVGADSSTSIGIGAEWNY